ncbi:MAG: tetratricopeptide repeat protein [Polyangiales bacterium]
MTPDDGVVLEIAARVYGLLRELDKAEAAARRYVALEPESPSAFGRLTWILTEAKKYDEAIGVAREAIRLDPNNFAAWANLGYAALEKKDLAQAEEATRQALRLKPGLNSATTNLVAILRERGAAQEAAEVLSRALARDPSNAAWRRQLEELREHLAAKDRVSWSDAVALTIGAALAAVAVSLVNGWAGIALGFVLLAITAWLWRGPRRDKKLPPG